MAKDKDGNLPIHLACFNRNARSDLINELIVLYPEALQIPNNEGNLPLHMACAGKAKEEILQKLLEENLTAAKCKNNAGGLPLHVACEKNAPPYTIECLLSNYPFAAQERDDQGNLPIHLECRHHIDLLSLEKLEALLREHPISLYIHNDDHMVPSCYFTRDLRDDLLSYAKTAIVSGYSVMLVLLFLADFQEVAQDWKDENGNCLLHHACNKSGREISCRTIAFLVNWLPKSPMIVNNNSKTPKDLLKEAASYKDNAGRLLLHRFAKLEGSYAVEANVSEDVINFVADAYPNSILVPDYNGMLPLHHACLNRWCHEDIVFALLKRYPDSLIVTPTMVCVVRESKRIKLI
jgi:ankyrin repeat protein